VDCRSEDEENQPKLTEATRPSAVGATNEQHSSCWPKEFHQAASKCEFNLIIETSRPS